MFESLAGLTQLNELYLRWNEFHGNGFEEAVNQLAKIENLRVLDLSWNLLGSARLSSRRSTCVGSLCEFLKSNKSIFQISFHLKKPIRFISLRLKRQLFQR
jgi:hypothetical protein